MRVHAVTLWLSPEVVTFSLQRNFSKIVSGNRRRQIAQ
jgi:hypothetical protein